jgi:hypothetical protein
MDLDGFPEGFANDGIRESGSAAKTQEPEYLFGNLSQAAASISVLGCRRRAE